MTGTTITQLVFSSVTLGSGNYASPLTIGNGGGIEPAAQGADGIFVPTTLHHGSITNNGLIEGGDGGSSVHHGGIGVDLAASATLTNNFNLFGGGAGNVTYAAGAAVDLSAGGVVVNDGRISGGQGGFAPKTSSAQLGGAGGSGVEIVGGVVKNLNTGDIFGGSGGYGHVVTGGRGRTGCDTCGRQHGHK